MPRPNRLSRDEADAEHARRGEDRVLRLPAEHRVLGLQRGDRMRRVRPTNRLGCGLGEPDVPNQPCGDEGGHCPNGFLDRRRRIDAVEVIEVDVVVVSPEAGEARLERRPHLVAFAEANATPAAELGGQDHVVAMTCDRPPDDLFAVTRPVGVRCVDERHSELEGACDGGDELIVLGAAVDAGEAHRPEPDGRDRRSISAELPVLHGEPPGWPGYRISGSRFGPRGRVGSLPSRLRPDHMKGTLMSTFDAGGFGQSGLAPGHWWQQQLAGRVTEDVIESRALAGNHLGDPAERPLWVYTPPGYASSEERYPSVYVIQGYSGQAVMWFNRTPFP